CGLVTAWRRAGSQRTVYSAKRFMGRRHSEVKSEEKMVPYGVVGSENEYVKIGVGDETFTPQEISAKVLRKLKESAESYLGQTVHKAVITVPAYFNDSQRQATKDAGQIAGLEVARIINEPTAAALAYGLDKKKDETIVVFDLGGGTFDVSVLEVSDVDEDSDNRVFQVISTSGDTHLGGDDFDEALINFVADEFSKESGMDLRKDPMALQRLQEACEKAKKELSSLPETEINLPFITVQDGVPKHLVTKISRSKFEELIDPLVERCKKPLKQALEDAGMKPSDIDEIVLVGGSTRVPKVREVVKAFFGKEPNQGVNPDEVVAVGAAIQGSVLAGDRTDVLLLDVTPLTLGIETEGGVMTPLVERNTTIPAERKNVFSTAADSQTAVTVSVYQGERKMARSNRLLGEFDLKDIPPQPRGMPQIEVKFDIDQNGILNVSAKELGTGKEASVQIKEAAGLSDDEIEQMRKDAEANADEDQRQFELAEARNRASSTVHQLEKQMSDNEDKLTDEDKAPTQAAIEKVNTAAAGEDVDAIKSATDELETVAQAFAKVLYEKDSAAAAAGEGDATSDAV
ncbi:MAG: molecular chaperone DnaK, partial [Planctomycetota bacterium]